MDEGRKRVLLIASSILVARHLRDDLNARTPHTEALMANAVRLAERILQKIDSLYPARDTADSSLRGRYDR